MRQPIDVPSLERYISRNVPEIQVPIDVKQVGASCIIRFHNTVLTFPIVRFWAVEPDIPTHSK